MKDKYFSKGYCIEPYKSKSSNQFCITQSTFRLVFRCSNAKQKENECLKCMWGLVCGEKTSLTPFTFNGGKCFGALQLYIGTNLKLYLFEQCNS